MTQSQPGKMIVGLDAAGRSNAALQAANAMSEQFSAHLRCVHMIEVPPIEDVGGRPDEMAEMYANIQASAAERLREAVVRVTGESAFENERVSVEAGVGHAARTLVKRAKEIDADWIFLGPHEHRQVFDFGSTTRAVLSQAHCGVWVQPGDWQPIRRILVPVDLSDESMRALGTARALAQTMGASVTALHCFQDPDFAYVSSPGYIGPGPLFSVEGACEAAEKSFNKTMDAAGTETDADSQPERRFVRGRPMDVILECQGGHDLIVMSSHGRTGLSAALLGNVAHGVLKRSSIPVLALRGAGSAS
ncbi:MAG: nucleotide-binding universal stress UspA family protein [Chlamydiales bacterium]|jgi:nucleotide-binding universal stress UspA family protein